MPLPFNKTIFLAAALPILVFGSPAAVCAKAGKWTVDLKGRGERTVSWTPEDGQKTKSVEEETLDIKWETFLASDLELSTKFTYKRTADKPEDGLDSVEDDIQAEATLKAQWWSLLLGYQQVYADNKDPENRVDLDTTYKAELKIEPEYDALPKLSYKYESTDDSTDQSYLGTLEYEMLKVLKLKVEAQKDVSAKKDDTDDTDARKWKGELTLSHDFWEFWKIDAKASSSREQQLSLDKDGLLMERQDKVTNEYLTKVASNPLKWVDLSVEVGEKQEKDVEVSDSKNVTDTFKGDVTLKPKPTKDMEFEFGYSNQQEKTSGTDSDSYKTVHEYNASLKYDVLKVFTLETSYDRKDDRENPVSPEEEVTDKRDDEYKVIGDLSVWKDQFAIKVTRDWKYSWENGAPSTFEHLWDIEAKIDWKNIPNLELKPTYTLKSTDDLIEDDTDSERKLEMELIYSIVLGKVVELKLDHIYRRTDKRPGGLESSTILREDDSKVELDFSDFLKGHTVSLSYTRKASDESLDDVGPEIDYDYIFKYEWEILEKYKLTFEYEYKDNQETEDEETYKSALTSKIFKDKIDITASYERIRKYGEEKSKEETYLIEVGGKF